MKQCIDHAELKRRLPIREVVEGLWQLHGDMMRSSSSAFRLIRTAWSRGLGQFEKANTMAWRRFKDVVQLWPRVFLF